MAVADAAVAVIVLVSVPVLVLVLSLGLFLFPPALWQGPESRILPVLTLATAYVAYIARLTRAGQRPPSPLARCSAWSLAWSSRKASLCSTQ